MSDYVPTEADLAVRECLENNRSFALIAGAGSGKTRSLIVALDEIRSHSGPILRQNGQRIACITYTNRAVEVISSRLGFDDLYQVSTLHSFLWGEVGRFQKDIRDALQNHRIPALLARAREKDNGRETKEARRAREQVARLEAELAGIADVAEFKYADAAFSDYLNGRLSHDDIIEIAGYLLAERPNFRRLLGLRYPYIFVDEAQDTFGSIVAGLNLVCAQDGLPLVGYFGDPWQQIYEGRAGDFAPPPGGRTINKVENFRSAPPVIELLNVFRTDVQQLPAGENRNLTGSVEIRLVQAETPLGERRRYSDPQLERALRAMDQALAAWGWDGREDVIRLFLVRQMIARRLGFSDLHQLFTGQYASSRAQDDYESGEHLLLKPFVKILCPLIAAHQRGESRKVIDILRADSPGYSTTGPNATRTLKEMIDRSNEQLQTLSGLWETGTIKDVLIFCRNHDFLSLSDRLRYQLAREPRQEEYDEALHGEDKGDWLADNFFAMPTVELQAYCDFMLENTAYSTQHGVKGEQYPNVMVVFDDVEASWNLYSFTKLLTPRTVGEPTDGQRDRGRKLAYVCFSRACENLRILLFTPNPVQAQQELIERLHLRPDQITIA
ncbi:MAG: ATP-dependent helicase [Geobacter sp.]|nr:ATP-dependent helicase [Geobacter sp.]